ncbi:MAG TPA: TfoX/Sxy family protein [Candidatus Limnocylindria bacterium]
MATQSSWSKSDPALVERFYAALPDHPAAERRKMFGYPACFVNGNYFAGLHEQRVVIKLPGDSRKVAPELADAPSFDPRGTGGGMKDWYVIPAEIAADERRLADLLAVTIVEVAKLPPKQPKPRR